MRVRSGGSGGGGGGLGAVSGGGGGEGALGGGDGFGVGQPPGGAGGGGSVQLTGGVVVLSQHHCGRGIVGVSVGGGDDDVYVWMDGCTHDVAVGHVRGVGVVRPRRGGRIHPDASGPVRRVGRHRGGHVTRLRCRIEMDTPCLLGITRVRASCGRSSALTSHRAACRSRASCAMAETALREMIANKSSQFR